MKKRAESAPRTQWRMRTELATQVMSRLNQRFDVEVPLRMMFEATTVAAFAARVEEIVRAAGAEREEIEL